MNEWVTNEIGNLPVTDVRVCVRPMLYAGDNLRCFACEVCEEGSAHLYWGGDREGAV